MDSHDEVPLLFGTGEHSLFGVLHRPRTGADPQPAFVFCHPIAEEKLWTHRVFVAYARRLAAAGHAVLRFDLTGNGDSEGCFSDVSIASLCSDLGCAIEEVRRLTETPAVSLLGLRLGANVAMMVAEEAHDIRHLILWAPITHGERYLQELLRSNLTTQMATYKEVRQDRAALVAELEQGRTVNVDGYEMGWPLYSSACRIRPEPGPHAFGGPCLIVQIDRQPRPAAELQQLAASYRAATLEFAREEPFWKEIPRFYQEAPNLFDVTSRWLEANANR